MRAAFQDRYGPPEVVHVREVATPVPAVDEVLVRVHAASVNRADLDALGPRPGFLRPILGMRAPRNKRTGIDVAGTVESVGPDVAAFKAGDRVFGDLFPFGLGAYAEYVCAPATALARIPEAMSFENAATLPHSAVLAAQGLRRGDGRTIGPGDKVLIDGASGNVGPFAVQIAKARGAEVTGVCRTEKVEFVRALGADHVLDYTKTDYTKQPERYNWILDTDSHHSILAVRRALRPNGVYVNLGGTAWPILSSLVVGPLISRFSDRWSGLLLWWKPFNPADVDTLTAMIAAGEIKPAIDRRYPLAEIAAALRYVDDGHARGKVIITS